MSSSTFQSTNEIFVLFFCYFNTANSILPSLGLCCDVAVTTCRADELRTTCNFFNQKSKRNLESGTETENNKQIE